MNNKYLYIIGGVIVVGIAYLVLNSSEEVANPLNEKINEKKVENKSVKINDSLHSENSIKINKVQKIEKEKVEIEDNFDNVKVSNNSKTESTTFVMNSNSSKKIETFIEENNLKPIQKVGDVEIFAKNFPQKNDFAPPMPPTLIKVRFKDKSEVIPLNTNLINANRKIYVVKKDNNEYKEIKEIDTKKLTSFTPPSIGQN